ncbi:FHA domain-containing protein [Nonomuraea dietziae]|uniref:FHA domain-containing protein n=1 Tax=Nonomuraea dietziae TaxID=65515 RepID=UPI0034392F33
MSGPATVTVNGQVHEVPPGLRYTFGRDPSCTVVLDAADHGISRQAGSIEQLGGTWWVINRSRKRTLHVIDDTGMAAPLPVSHPEWPPSRRPVDQLGLTVLVAGDTWTHVLRVSACSLEAVAEGPATVDPVSTACHVPAMTEPRRAALVAMASGYLRRYPDYDPRPLTYQETADLLGLRRDQVRKRIEYLREELVEARVPGLEGPDARRALCEWFLGMRVIGPRDLDWLRHRLRSAPDAPRREPW